MTQHRDSANKSFTFRGVVESAASFFPRSWRLGLFKHLPWVFIEQGTVWTCFWLCFLKGGFYLLAGITKLLVGFKQPQNLPLPSLCGHREPPARDSSPGPELRSVCTSPPGWKEPHTACGYVCAGGTREHFPVLSVGGCCIPCQDFCQYRHFCSLVSAWVSEPPFQALGAQQQSQQIPQQIQGSSAGFLGSPGTAQAKPGGWTRAWMLPSWC